MGCSRCAISMLCGRSCRGLGPTALFDLPWLPLYLAIIFAFHTALGIAALIGAIVLIALTLHDRSPGAPADELGHGLCA